MILSDRKIKILEAIVNDYVVTAEPVGSRTIAKKYDFGISSATIRNEMSDLEELGYISQPHLSSGRIPSDKGYRLYVDSLMKKSKPTKAQMNFLQQLVTTNVNQIDFLMKETARVLAVMTNYTTIVSEPLKVPLKIKHVQLVPIDENSLMVVLVSDRKAVKSVIVNLNQSPSYEVLNSLSLLMNNIVKDKTLDELGSDVVGDLKICFGNYLSIVEPVIDGLKRIMNLDDDAQLYTSGVKNILSFPEFSDVSKASEIFEALEEKQQLLEILDTCNTDAIQVLIGSENEFNAIKNCSLVKAHFNLANKNLGSIAVLGPTRMDYKKVIAILDCVINELNENTDSADNGRELDGL